MTYSVRLFKRKMRPVLSFMLVIFVSLGLLGQGCGKKPTVTAALVTECDLPQDQSKSLIGRWRIAPVPIAFHEGDFSDSEIQAMVKAADTWNQFFAGSLGYGGLDYSNDDGSVKTINEAKPLFSCNNPIIDPQGGGYNGAIVIYKQSIWAYKDKSSTIARTSTCPDGTRHFYTGFIELNFESFFAAGKKQPDIESIMLHEYGHLLGLKHSCEGASVDGIPNCSDVTLNPTYRSASLFPTFGYTPDGKGEQRRKVNQNDQGRMNCLYQ